MSNEAMSEYPRLNGETIESAIYSCEFRRGHEIFSDEQSEQLAAFLDLRDARAEIAEMRAVFKKLHAVISRECNDMLLQVLGKYADEVTE